MKSAAYEIKETILVLPKEKETDVYHKELNLVFARIRGEDIIGLDDAEKLKQYILQLFVGLKEE